MASRMSRNLINVRPGDPAFLISTNLCDYFELGDRAGVDYWLEGLIVGPPPEFVFNGRIYVKGHGQGTIIDNFPRGPTPSGWTKRALLNGNGYELVSGNETLFGFEELPGHICRVTVNLYAQ